MKKITLMMFALAATFTIQAQEISQDQGTDIFSIPSDNPEVETVFTQNVGDEYGQNGVSCGDQAGGTTADNFYFRKYELGALGVTGSVALTGVEFVPATNGGESLITVYAWDAPSFPAGFDITDMPTPLAIGQAIVTSDEVGSKVRIEFDTPGIANEDMSIVVAVATTDDDPTWFLATTAEQTAPTWLAASACGFNTPILVEDVGDGFPEAKHVVDLVIDDELSVGSVLSQNVSVYPNPSSDVFNISLPANAEVLGSSLVDILGKTTGVVYNNGEMNVSALAPGVYFLNLNTNLGSFTQKVVVKQ